MPQSVDLQFVMVEFVENLGMFFYDLNRTSDSGNDKNVAEIYLEMNHPVDTNERKFFARFLSLPLISFFFFLISTLYLYNLPVHPFI